MHTHAFLLHKNFTKENQFQKCCTFNNTGTTQAYFLLCLIEYHESVGVYSTSLLLSFFLICRRALRFNKFAVKHFLCMLAKRDSFGNTTDTAQRRAERTDFF